MNHELLILDPKGSSSMLEPLLVLDILIAAPTRWAPQLIERPFDGFRILPTSRLRTVLDTWAKDRGMRCSVANSDDDWLCSVGAVLIFDHETRVEAGALLSAFGVPVVHFDLEQGAFIDSDDAEMSPIVLSVASPQFNEATSGVSEG